ncbi:Kinesin light chain 3 [Rhizophlyctis rosea]|uniref:Kinesin light chain 3 n=1 Tax=Rhizophlyctis rosea TaxID=64517 RepID=A0AAD5S8Y6_9FUNG|nr:Kinesin light chain 3 [Rhizophlyctis rosea]
MLSELSLQGVHLSYLDAFIAQYGGQQKLAGLSTADVATKLIKRKSTTSIVNQLVEQNSTSVGTANWFISYSWKNEFLDTVDAVKQYFQDQKLDNVVIWIDIFCESQHDATEKTAAWWLGPYSSAISKIGNVLLVAEPWHDPTSLTDSRYVSVWKSLTKSNALTPFALNSCLFDLYACARTSSRFAFALSPFSLPAFTSSLEEDPYLFYTTLLSISTSTSTSTPANLNASLHHAITSSIGYDSLDRLLFALLFSSLVKTYYTHIAASKISQDEVTHANLLYSLGRLYLDQDRQSEMEPLYLECLNIRAELYGDDHRDTLKAATSLGESYAHQGKYEKAEKLYLEILERRKKALGSDHVDVFASMYNLATLYSQWGKEAEAERYYLDILKWKRKVLGEEHRDTLASLHNLAELYLARGLYAKAEPLAKEALVGRKATLGASNPDTLTTLTCLAGIYNDSGDYVKAEPLYVEVLEKRRDVLGEEDEATLVSLDLLAGLYKNKGEFDKAEELYKESLERRKAALGEDHPDVAVSGEQVEEVRKEKEEGTVEPVAAVTTAENEETKDQPTDLQRAASRRTTHTRTLSRLGKPHERQGSEWQQIIEEAGATVLDSSDATTTANKRNSTLGRAVTLTRPGTLGRRDRAATLTRSTLPRTQPTLTYALVPATGVTTTAQSCYSPTCSSDFTTHCYSTSCPRRFEQQVNRLLGEGSTLIGDSSTELQLSLPELKDREVSVEKEETESVSGKSLNVQVGTLAREEAKKKGFWKNMFGLKKKGKR